MFRFGTPPCDVTFCDPIPVISCNALQGRKSGVNLSQYVDEAVFYRLIAAQHVEEDDTVKCGLIDSLGDLCERGWDETSHP